MLNVNVKIFTMYLEYDIIIIKKYWLHFCHFVSIHTNKRISMLSKLIKQEKSIKITSEKSSIYTLIIEKVD